MPTLERLSNEKLAEDAAYSRALDELHGQGISSPTTSRLAEHLGWSREKVKRVREARLADLRPS